jgi:hypothetical protein
MRSIKYIVTLVVLVFALSGCEKYEILEPGTEQVDADRRHEELLYNDLHEFEPVNSGGFQERGDDGRPSDDGDGITDDDDEDEDSEENQDKKAAQ